MVSATLAMVTGLCNRLPSTSKVFRHGYVPISFYINILSAMVFKMPTHGSIGWCNLPWQWLPVPVRNRVPDLQAWCIKVHYDMAMWANILLDTPLQPPFITST